MVDIEQTRYAVDKLIELYEEERESDSRLKQMDAEMKVTALKAIRRDLQKAATG